MSGVRDLATDENGDIAIREGDFFTENSESRTYSLLSIARKGSSTRHPLSGMDLCSFDSAPKTGEIAAQISKRIELQCREEGLTVKSLRVSVIRVAGEPDFLIETDLERKRKTYGS